MYQYYLETWDENQNTTFEKIIVREKKIQRIWVVFRNLQKKYNLLDCFGCRLSPVDEWNKRKVLRIGNTTGIYNIG